jgi:hypothetical protein
MMPRKFRERTLNDLRESAKKAIQNGRCVTVSGKQLLTLLDNHEGLALLACDPPDIANPVYLQ